MRKEDAVLLELSKGQEGQLPNIRTILPSILTVPRYLRAQPSWYTSTVTEIMSDHSIYLRVSGVYVHGELLSWRLTPSPTYVGLGRFQYGPNVISVHVTITEQIDDARNQDPGMDEGKLSKIAVQVALFVPEPLKSWLFFFSLFLRIQVL